MVAHAFNHHLGGRGRDLCEFKGSLVYRESSRMVRTTQRNPVLNSYPKKNPPPSKKKKKKKQKTKKKKY